MMLSLLPGTAFAAEPERQVSAANTAAAGTQYAASRASVRLINDSKIYKDAWEVLRLTNQHRMSLGLRPLSTTDGMQKVANQRAYEISYDYRPDHSRPDGSDCWTAYSAYSVPYNGAAENIAKGQTSPREVVTAWINSPGHRRNMESSSYVHMGAGAWTENAWTQDFGVSSRCSFSNLRLSKSSISGNGSNLETLLANADIMVTATCAVHGTSYLPLIAGMCSGYSSSASGTQSVQVSYQGLSTTLSITNSGGSTTPSSYTVYFNGNGGSLPYSSMTVTNGRTYGTMPIPTRSGYTFTGWYTSPSGGSQIYSSTTVNLSGSQTLYAQWKQNPSQSSYWTEVTSNSTGTALVRGAANKTLTQNMVLIYYSSGCGYSTTYVPQFKALAESQRIPMQGYEHYANGQLSALWTYGFASGSIGWPCVLTYNAATKTAKFTHSVRSMSAFQAALNDNGLGSGGGTSSRYTVTFSPNGGSLSAAYRTKTVTKGGTYGALPTPTRSGYTFAGWYTSPLSLIHI